LSKGKEEAYPKLLISGTLPSWLADMTGLTTLDIDLPLLSGTIPHQLFRKLTNLRVLRLVAPKLSWPSITCCPVSEDPGPYGVLSALTALETLEIDLHLLTGAIPVNFFWYLSDLRNLRFVAPKLTGDTSSGWEGISDMADLRTFELDLPQVSGEIATEFFAGLTKLTDFKLGGLLLAKISGVLPDMAPLVNLKNLDIAKTSLTGTCCVGERGSGGGGQSSWSTNQP
jgi:hypothetical protein